MANLKNKMGMETYKKPKKKVLLGVFALSIITIIGTISYAYFTSTGTSVNQTAEIGTAKVSAIFEDADTGVSKTLNFGESFTKRFKITNNGTVDAHVKMYWEKLVNTYTERSLTYTLSKSSTIDGTYTAIAGLENVLMPQAKEESTEVLASDLTIPVGEPEYYELKVTLNYLSDVNQDSDLTASFYAWFKLEDINYKEKPVNEFANMLIAKANDASIIDYNSGNKGEMFAFDHTATGQVSTWTADELRDYRYIGKNPNNYITFNDETWRIIGVFTVETEDGSKEQLVKIIRDASIGNLTWNFTQVNSAYTNEWTNGSLQTMLNKTYLNTEGSFTYEGETIPKGLSTTARSQIANVKYYLGASTTNTGLGGPDYYAFERGTTTCATAGNCSGQTRETSIMQRVGLMYPSDYIYTYANEVDTKCFQDGYNCDRSTPTDGWLFNSSYQLTQSPSARTADTAFAVHSAGMATDYDVNTGYGVRPTVYLASDILIQGTGGSKDPYTIKANG